MPWGFFFVFMYGRFRWAENFFCVLGLNLFLVVASYIQKTG